MLELKEGSPPTTGVYVAYVNDALVDTFSDRRLLFWDGTGWYHLNSTIKYRDHVYGWVGPLPPMRLING